MAGVAEMACVMSSVMRVANTEPRTATPVTVPTWRNVELVRDATAARRGSTVAAAAMASLGLTSSRPMPATTSPGTRLCQVLAVVRRLISHSPPATMARPAHMGSFSGI